jgi:hypothetical protein
MYHRRASIVNEAVELRRMYVGQSGKRGLKGTHGIARRLRGAIHHEAVIDS